MKQVDDRSRYKKELHNTARKDANAAKRRSKGKQSSALSPALLTQYVCGNDRTGDCIRRALNAWSFSYAVDKNGKIMRTCNLCHLEEEACLAAIHLCSRDPPIIEHPPIVPSKVGGQKCGLCFNGPGRSHACKSRLFKRCMVDAHGHPGLNPETVLLSKASSEAEVSEILQTPTKLYKSSFFMDLDSDGYIGAANVVLATKDANNSRVQSTTNVFVGHTGCMGRGLFALKQHMPRGALSLMCGGSIRKPAPTQASDPGLSKFDREIALRDGSCCVVTVELWDTKCVAYLVNHAHHEPNMESLHGPNGIVLLPVRTIMPGEQFLYNYLAVCDEVEEEMLCKCDRCNAGMTPDGRDQYMVVWKGRQFQS